MLIYNHKKEFLGIDEDDLKILGLSNLADLQSEAADFADLFVKTPGFIHNFKHVHWIDYITCNDSGIESKAIIHARGKNYATNIEIKTIYLVDNPSQKAYLVSLAGIRPMSGAQVEKISADIAQKPAPKTIIKPAEPIKPSAPEKSAPRAAFDPYDVTHDELPSLVKDVYEDVEHKFDLAVDVPLDIEKEEKPLDFIAEPIFEKHEEAQKTPIIEVEKAVEKEDLENPFANYVYNPKVASQDLGLPVDLVEEFIQDFIAQANSFKNELYESAKSRNLDNLKIQSHKLKGVAANLRVEDALDALSKINTSDDESEIKINLDRLYKIINKLSNKGDALVEPEVQKIETAKEDADDDLILSFKDDSFAPSKKQSSVADADIIEINDSQVPDSIEIAELADDEFLKPQITIDEDEISNEVLSVTESPVTSHESTKEKVDTALHYNKKQIAHDIGLDIDSFNELFEDYLNEAKELSKSMADSIEKNDLRACKSSAIKLKGMSENMRIHDFDTTLEAIINSTEAARSKGFVENIISKLDLISKIEDK